MKTYSNSYILNMVQKPYTHKMTNTFGFKCASDNSENSKKLWNARYISWQKLYQAEKVRPIKQVSLKVHIHWASHARDPWSHARLHSFPGNQQCCLHMYTVFFHHIVIVFVRNYHNMVKKYCIHMYTTLLVTWETVKPLMRSRTSCMRCSVYVHL